MTNQEQATKIVNDYWADEHSKQADLVTAIAAALEASEKRGAEEFTRHHHNPIVDQLRAENDALRTRVAELEAIVTQRNNESSARWQEITAARVEAAGTLKIIRQYLVTGKWQQPNGVLNFIDAEIAALERGKDNP